jgi:hypothetical protein
MINATQAREKTDTILGSISQRTVKEIELEIDSASSRGESYATFPLLGKILPAEKIIELLKNLNYRVERVQGGGELGQGPKYDYLRISW